MQIWSAIGESKSTNRAANIFNRLDRKARTTIPHEAWRSIVYLLAWPGMDAEAFLDSNRSTEKPQSTEWLWASAKTAIGVLLLWLIARRLPEPLAQGKLVLQQLTGNHQPLHFTSSFANRAEFYIAIKLFCGIVLDETVATVNLHALIGTFNSNFARIQLRHG